MPTLALPFRFARLGDALPLRGAETLLHFHVRRDAREAYGFDDALFAIRGDVIFANPAAAHAFALAYNARRGLAPEAGLRPAELNAMGLIHEILHGVIGVYRRRFGSGPLKELLGSLRAELGDRFATTLRAFVETFPPPSIYAGRETTETFLRGALDGVAAEEWMLEELLLVWIANQNRGYAPLKELIRDDDLVETTAYAGLVQSMTAFFAAQPAFGPGGETLIDLLLAPMRASPDSLAGQLAYMRARWGLLLGDDALWAKLLLGVDTLAEEGRWFLRKSHGKPEPESPAPPSYGGEYYEGEPEAFSMDRNWMPRVVMMAKSTFVWLAQLSRTYERAVDTLRDIPDEELDALARRGFTALWLIGLWQRSRASEKIKQLHGDHDAVASAYSLHDYEIAPELGGWSAYEDLKSRAARRGIRLASDMVPNHMGLDSRWVVEHPERFLQTPEPPFPNYSYNGPDLSEDDRVGLYIEDGYWSRSDAAVTFKRVDRHTGDTTYVFHGNDGTSMPWNDTAQLDYLRADVRETVIQTILHVARLFPIIRFDAAMTLAKRHYQRLWFPVPGSGGDIPSRARWALTKEQFDAAFPVEFWREVVDRVAAEVPDTLLLAEAFWMMEGYFVRTLGMHRVYNSAFMHMLKKEDNASFRTSVRNVLEFNPQILKRHVNFMNNPDEETALAQFGRDDKYFGVCVVLATLPGLPMFGHGQIEGFSEKYGMEYKRPKKDETPDANLVGRHEREVFPLLRRRHAFAEVDQFLMYDVVTPEGHVDEDVLAYSNGSGEGRSLVVYHNKYKDTRGWIRRSVGFLERGVIVQRTLAEGLGLSAAARGDRDVYVAFRDSRTGLEYLRSAKAIEDEGLWVELGAFKYQVFWEMRDLVSTPQAPYDRLCQELGGRGVPSIDQALLDLAFRPVHASLWEAIGPGSVAWLLEKQDEGALHQKLDHLEDGVRALGGSLGDTLPAHAALEARFLRLAEAARSIDAPGERATLVAWLYVEAIGDLVGALPESARPADPFEAWALARVVTRALRQAELDEARARQAAALVHLLAAGAIDPALPLARATLVALGEAEGRVAVDAHPWEGVTYVSKERLAELASALATRAYVEAPEEVALSTSDGNGASASPSKTPPAPDPAVDRGLQVAEILAVAERAGYRLDAIVAALGAPASLRTVESGPLP